ncbi:MAG: MetS family NSS transporter small subunit [bacterium]
MFASILAKLPGSAIAMLVVTSLVLYGGIVVCVVLAIKRKP